MILKLFCYILVGYLLLFIIYHEGAKPKNDEKFWYILAKKLDAICSIGYAIVVPILWVEIIVVGYMLIGILK